MSLTVVPWQNWWQRKGGSIHQHRSPERIPEDLKTFFNYFGRWFQHRSLPFRNFSSSTIAQHEVREKKTTKFIARLSIINASLLAGTLCSLGTNKRTQQTISELSHLMTLYHLLDNVFCQRRWRKAPLDDTLKLFNSLSISEEFETLVAWFLETQTYSESLSSPRDLTFDLKFLLLIVTFNRFLVFHSECYRLSSDSSLSFCSHSTEKTEEVTCRMLFRARKHYQLHFWFPLH